MLPRTGRRGELQELFTQHCAKEVRNNHDDVDLRLWYFKHACTPVCATVGLWVGMLAFKCGGPSPPSLRTRVRSRSSSMDLGETTDPAPSAMVIVVGLTLPCWAWPRNLLATPSAYKSAHIASNMVLHLCILLLLLLRFPTCGVLRLLFHMFFLGQFR